MELMFNQINNYIDRLKRCGFSISEATRISYDMQKNYGWDGLEDYVKSIEEDTYVDKLQPESCVNA